MSVLNFIDVFDSIVTEVRSEYDLSESEKPYFMYGHPIDITKQLELKNNSSDRFKKYPLVCLILDLPMSGGGSIDIGYKTSPQILILTETDQAFTSIQRKTTTFDPILYPIAKLLLEKVNSSGYIKSLMNDYEFSWTDRYFWGREGIRMRGYDGVIFNDYLDGIEINLENLQVYKQNYCTI